MARVALCPQCNNELFVADDADSIAWAKCPECHAFFQIQDAPAREIPNVLLVDDGTAVGGSQPQDSDETAWAPLETARSDSRITFSESSAQTIPEIESATDPTSDAPETSQRSAATIADVSSLTTWSDVRPEKVDAASPAAPLGDSPLEAPRPASLEDSAERIDKWFRSAKTLADIPPMPEGELPTLITPHADDPPSTTAAGGATIDIDAAASGDAGSDTEFELAHAPVLPENSAAWDDSERMERLLADIDGEPAGKLAPEKQTEPAAIANDDHVEGAVPWAREIQQTPAITSGRRGRSKKSVVRTIAMTAIAGVLGSALGYYALFWIAGPSADFLDVAQYLPGVVLPGEFQSPAAQLTRSGQPSNVADDTAEIQAGYTAAVEPQGEPSSIDDRTGSVSESARPSGEPSRFDAQPATPLVSDAPRAATAAVVNAPSFTADELAVALAAAKEAQPGLVAGDLDDSKEVQRAKGFSYSLLCDLAQKAAFADKTSRADYVAPLNSEAETLFRQTLADPHTREEVARIVPKWIDAPSRKHGGVFFAGTVTSDVDKGTVAECQIDLGGTALTILVPQEQAERLTASARPVGVVGWIVDRPAEQVSGYTGDAPQAIWVSRLISLE